MFDCRLGSVADFLEKEIIQSSSLLWFVSTIAESKQLLLKVSFIEALNLDTLYSTFI